METVVDTITPALKRMTSKQLKKTYYAVVRQGANILVRTAKRHLSTDAHIRNIYSKNRWNGKTLASGIRIGRLKSMDPDAIGVCVHIMGDHRLKWFQDGSRERTRGKGVEKKVHVGPRRTKVRTDTFQVFVSPKSGNGIKPYAAGQVSFRTFKAHEFYSTGKMKASHFFTNAQAACEKEIFDGETERLKKYIEKKWKQ